MASDVMQDAPDAMPELQPPGEDHSMQQLMQHTVRLWTVYAVVWYGVGPRDGRIRPPRRSTTSLTSDGNVLRRARVCF